MENMVNRARVWPQRRVLVTGQTGFKGAWLAFWLDRLGARAGSVVVDGNLGANPAFGAILAQLRRGQGVVSTRRPIGAAYGAAMLATWPRCPPLPETFTHMSWQLDSLAAYREAWLRQALATG